LPTGCGRPSSTSARPSSEIASGAALPEAFLYSWLANVVALFAAAWIIPGVTYGSSWWTLLLAALVFALVNAIVRPLVILFTLPAVILSLGVALFFISMLMLWLTDEIVDDFETGGFWSVAGAAVIVWLVNLFLGALLGRQQGGRRDRGART
jgi:putative membrane protein